MKKWLGRLKERLGRLKPWLKQHWKIVLVVAVAVGVFLFVILKKPSAIAAAVNPPVGATGGAAGGDTSAPASPATSTGVASAVGGRGTSGGSLFDPPAPFVSRPSLPTSVPAPVSFSQTAILAATGAAAGATAPAGPSGISQMWSAAKSLVPAPQAGNFGTTTSGVIQNAGAAFAKAAAAAQRQTIQRAQGPSPKTAPKRITGPIPRPPVKPEPTPGVSGGGRSIGGHGAQ